MEKNDRGVRSILVLGGGAAGWLAAALLTRALRPERYRVIVLDDSRQTPRPASEATGPVFRHTLALLGVDEAQLMRATDATFSLGIEFRDWSATGEHYLHGYGAVGARLEAVPFHHYWLRLRELGDPHGFEEYSIACCAARSGRFAHPSSDRTSPLSLYSYGYHFNAQQLTAYLRAYAEQRGAVCTSGRAIELQRSASGLVQSVVLEDHARLEADLVLDCNAASDSPVTGALSGAWQDWEGWWPGNRAVLIDGAKPVELKPCSQFQALSQGWAWHTPLRRGSEHGFAYRSDMLSDDQALASARALAGAQAEFGQPRVLRFQVGRPLKFRQGNYIALPGASLPPLHHLRLQLVQTGVSRLLLLFPQDTSDPDDAAEYNRLTAFEYDRIRDFLAAHFLLSARTDSPLWRDRAQIGISDELEQRLALFRDSGRLGSFEDEPFDQDDWMSLLVGRGIMPPQHDPLADVMNIEDVRSALATARHSIARAAASLPLHERYLADRQ
ncbi:MAG TPA: tryptophan halogenase family protein [Steroidobacteraceae bacterium]